MQDAEIKKLTDDSFEAAIAKGVTLVDFYADWCGPCRMLAPVLDQVAKDVSGVACVAKVDIDHAQKIAGEQQITSVPTMILFKDGKEEKRIIGLRDADFIKDLIQSVC